MPIIKKRNKATKGPALSEEGKAFCEGVGEFCKRFLITDRQFSDLCNYTFQKSTANRIKNADPTLTETLIEEVRPVIVTSFVNYLIDKGFNSYEIEAELSPIFEIEEFKFMLFNRCELTPEACRFFGFKHDPFDVDRMPSFNEIFTYPELDNAVERVRDAVLYQRFVAVIGPVGSGKTLLKQRVAAELQRADQKTQILYPEFFDMSEVNVAGIAYQILSELEQKMPANKLERVNKIRKVLSSMHSEDIRSALFLDECHRLNDKVLSALKNFWEMNNGAFSRLLGVVLFGQPSFVDARLRDVKFKEIRQRVQIIEMPNLANSAASYLAHRISIAGGDLNHIFTQDAIDRICQNADTPLALGNLVNEALMHAFERQEKTVDTGQTFFKRLKMDSNVLAIRSKKAA